MGKKTKANCTYNFTIMTSVYSNLIKKNNYCSRFVKPVRAINFKQTLSILA